MANKPIDMKKLRAALRLHIKGHGKRSIAQVCGISKNTVKKYLAVYQALAVPWDVIEQLDDKGLFELFAQAPGKSPRPKMQQLYAFFPYMHKELRKTGPKEIGRASCRERV